MGFTADKRPATTIELRIHADTERGDNDTVKMGQAAAGLVDSGGVGCGDASTTTAATRVNERRTSRGNLEGVPTTTFKTT